MNIAKLTLEKTLSGVEHRIKVLEKERDKVIVSCELEKLNKRKRLLEKKINKLYDTVIPVEFYKK